MFLKARVTHVLLSFWRTQLFFGEGLVPWSVNSGNTLSSLWKSTAHVYLLKALRSSVGKKTVWFSLAQHFLGWFGHRNFCCCCSACYHLLTLWNIVWKTLAYCYVYRKPKQTLGMLVRIRMELLLSRWLASRRQAGKWPAHSFFNWFLWLCAAVASKAESQMAEDLLNSS